MLERFTLQVNSLTYTVEVYQANQTLLYKVSTDPVTYLWIDENGEWASDSENKEFIKEVGRAIEGRDD